MRQRFMAWLDTTAGRATFVLVWVWLTFMAVGLVQFLTGGGPWGFIFGTGLVLWIVLMIYLVPRVSNWVQYRKWDARLDHYKDKS